MKKFYGKHLTQYMGDTKPKLEKNETGFDKGRFGPLQMTAFKTQEGQFAKTSPRSNVTESVAGNK